MSFYSRRILPWLIDKAMRKASFVSLRATVLEDASGNILEIGFGSGLNLPFYPRTVTSITALDPSSELRALAENTIKISSIPVHFVLGSAEQMPFASASFDTVVSTWTLCSIPDVDRALEEIKRVLKPGGQFLFIEHGRGRSRLTQRIQERLTPFWKRMAGGCHLDRPMQELIERHGFQTTCTSFPGRGISRPLLRMYEGQAWRPGFQQNVSPNRSVKSFPCSDPSP